MSDVVAEHVKRIGFLESELVSALAQLTAVTKERDAMREAIEYAIDNGDVCRCPEDRPELKCLRCTLQSALGKIREER